MHPLSVCVAFGHRESVKFAGILVQQDYSSSLYYSIHATMKNKFIQGRLYRSKATINGLRCKY